jgi:hypothetical protein
MSREVRAVLASGARYLQSILELQASARNDNTGVCYLRSIRRKRILHISTTLLSPRLKREGSGNKGKERYGDGP